MEFKTTLVVVFLANALLISAQVPIPAKPLGFVYKNTSITAPVHIDAFLDLACPDSKTAFPVMKQVADMYTDGRVRVKFLIFPLPYHRNAHMAAIAAEAIHSNPMNGHTPDESAIAWAQEVFAMQSKWSDSATRELNYDATQTLIASYSSSLGYDAASFKKMMSNSDYDWNARVMWKYGCSRGVAGTPWFFVNGVYVAADGSWNAAKWKQLIDGLLNGRNFFNYL